MIGSRWRCLASFLVLLTVVLVLARCAKIGGESGNQSANQSKAAKRKFNLHTSGTFSGIYTDTISTECVQCHQPGGSAAAIGVQLDFTSQASAYQTLTSGSVAASDWTGKCPNVPLVIAGNPTSTYLLGTIFDDYNTDNFNNVAGCTPFKHMGLNLSNDEKNSMVQWVQNGAQNN